MHHLRARTAAGQLALLALALPAAGNTVWRVKPSAPPGGDGQSWPTALRQLDEALALAQPGDEVWLAQGRYLPTLRSDPADPRSAGFAVAGVKLYGGFLGSESSTGQRLGSAARTWLSGDLGVPGRSDDNAYTVVAVNGFVRLDRLTIAGGNSDAAADQRGGGIEFTVNGAGGGAQLELVDCILRDNRAVRGGAVFAQLGWLHAKRTRFVDNYAQNGGALWAQTVEVDAQNVVFLRNVAADRGGALFATSIADDLGVPRVQVTNALFAHNSAQRGGAVCAAGSQFTQGQALFHDCTFSDNDASVAGGGLYAVTGVAFPGVLQLDNSIVWGNAAPAEPEIAGAATLRACIAPLPGSDTFYADPLFVPGSYRLQALSPAIDAGSVALLRRDVLDLDDDGVLFEMLPVDLDGGARFVGPEVDLGAYEH